MTTASRPFELTDPADAQRFWFLDKIHNPRALPPLSCDLTVIQSDVSPIGLETRIVNGYAYGSPKSMQPPPPMPELPDGAALANWHEKYLPATRRQYELLRDAPYSSMPALEHIAFIRAQIRPTFIAFADTIISAMEIGPEASRLAALLESRLGPEADLLSATILHGGGSQTREIGTEVRALADAARASNGVLAALQQRDFEAALNSTAEPWASALRAFIDDHADEIALWTELHEPAWNEEPLPLLRMVAASLDAPTAERRDASAEALAGVRATLAPEDLPALDAAIATSRNYVPVIEHRARWQLKLAGALRKAFIELGRKFEAEGKLDRANDIFWLHLDELEAVANGELEPRNIVPGRRDEWLEQLTLTAPIMIGLPVPFEMLGAANPMLRRMFGAVALEAATETTVHGVGASAGVVRGRARVVHSLNEADDLEDGDILVCPSTSPPWSPYFAVVSGIVTEAGGMISHAAIEAREYGIPAVVGTRDGTSRIPDGAMITIDGTAGSITIER